jgi:NAD(P)-dependent dehydrogenase (short-subunit alcohol dehydrogenase family)
MNELRFDDRVAIVTGAGRGLGRAHARLLASRGALVLVNDSGAAVDGENPDPSVAEAVAAEIRADGGVAVADGNSVATAAGGEAIVAHALDEFGHLDIVVNNAGILQDKAFHNMTPEMFDAVVAVHLAGTFYVTKPAYVHMREQRYGRIVVTTSGAGTYGNFGQTNYSSAKMAVVGFARTVSTEGSRYNIKANVISPAALSRMTESLMSESAGRALPPHLVSPAVAWLCHEDCPVAGEIIAASGGRVARVFVGETPGFAKLDLTIEDVAEHFDEIMDVSGYVIPADIADAGRLSAQVIGKVKS